MKAYTRRSTCKLCNGSDFKLVLPMRSSPIADAFVPKKLKEHHQELIPLDLYQCQSCGHAQNIDVVHPDLLFREYMFTTASSPGLVRHYQEYAQDIVQKLGLPNNALVLEIGSNDGTLLRFFKDLGLQVMGVDPACDIAQQATLAGIPTLPEFFSSALAKQIQGPVQLIVANNVYAHSDQLADMTIGIASLLDKTGVFVFEVSYLMDIVDKFLFDTIYHEHVSYHSITPLVIFLQKHGLELFNVEKVGTKGGSIRCYVQKLKGPRLIHDSVTQMMHHEQVRKLHEPAIFQKYAEDIQKKKEALHSFLTNESNKGKRVVGYGASTTVTTLIYQFELEDKMSFLVDDNVKKQGLLSPGCHLEVKSSAALYEERPDIVLVLAWQYAQPILQKHKRFLEEEHGTFVVPLPECTIYRTRSASADRSLTTLV